ncbi:uncharacterized protein LOC121384598 [Gigantopelta aegis]|uniref:uncharacterized protein LOC121384598 n=1 Tax=Gigantopelta aegis TaxID=1735272 RepID=UPI001B8887AB|nr:uncharacterized protein LOC121384598 [Gigantopelta aegis]
MSCNWHNGDYFSELIRGDKRSHAALEMLVDDLHGDKERTITQFLCHSGSEDFLWGLIKLLGSDIPRMAGNAAYIIGTVAESDLGCYRILSLAREQTRGNHSILEDLTRMLKFDDSESVMNAAGTMGTLAESNEGREWILAEQCLDRTLDHVTALLHADNMWTASNAALVLARLCISEDGCNKVLGHYNSSFILSKLVQALGSDEAGRGMNSAFAIGRLCDMDVGRKRLLLLPESEKMISALAKMLSCEDTGASKNACFALSCLATNKEGHTRLLNNIYANDVMKRLAELLSADDSETGWFAAMTLRTLASQPKGCLKLRENHNIYLALKAIDMKPDINPDLKDEVTMTLEILKKLEKPSPPVIEVTGAYSVRVAWDEVTTKSGFTVRYQLFEAVSGSCVYTGKECCCDVDNLAPFTPYSFKLRAFTEGDESPFSDYVSVTTEEAEPSAPTNVKILGSTVTQLKVGWDPPEQSNGILKGYYIYYGRNIVEYTADTSFIITGLSANTQYEIMVCAATGKGKGDKASVFGTTPELGAHAPSRPQVHVLGRNEIHVSWGPPEVPLGRITRYDVVMNGRVVYSGTDLSFTTRRLTPDTDYTFIIVALTSEGKFESKSTKKRTSKDEYDTSRPPLYQTPPVRKESLGEEIPQKPAPLKKKKSETKLSRTPSAKTGLKSSGHDSGSVRPSSAESILTSANGITENASLVKDSQKWHPNSSLPNGVQKSKTAITKYNVQCDIKKENVNPHSKSSKDSTRTSSSKERAMVRTEKVTSASKAMFPIPVSYVSIHGGDDMPGDGEPGKTNFELKKSLGKTASMYDATTACNGLKLERSKTSYIGAKPSGKSKPSSQVVDGESDHLSDMSGGNSSRTDSPEKVVNVSPLPKPIIPSQHYLDGGGHNLEGMPHMSRSLPSPQMAKEIINYLDAECFDLDSPYKSKKFISDLSSSTAYLTLSHRGASDYLIDQQEFIQRTNNFISYHRPGLKKAVPPKMNFSGSTIHSTMVPEIPENRSAKTHNKFIPMQLRTQPGNLTGQLQRVTTSLLEPRGFPARRLESLSRSHTQMMMEARQQQSNKRLRQHSLGNADLDLIGITTTNPHLLGKDKLVRSRGSSHRRLNHSAHLREPDSAILGQSWAS